jgi:hypothetical protein
MTRAARANPRQVAQLRREPASAPAAEKPLIRGTASPIILPMDVVDLGRVLAAVVAAGCYDPSPGEGAPCSPRGECPSGLVCDTGVCTREPAQPLDELLDPFSRPDGAAIGNGWIEKTAATYSLTGGEVVRIQTTESYRDNMVYRPASEDVRDVEIAIGVRFTALPPEFAQIFVRGASATIAVPDSYDGYLFYVQGGQADEAVLGRQRGTPFVTTLSRFPLSPPLDAGSRYRMTLRATGAQPVALRAKIERREGDAWIAIGETAVEDHAATQITDAGTVGFAGNESATYIYDDFRRVSLAP